jgi:hypothetical protein
MDLLGTLDVVIPPAGFSVHPACSPTWTPGACCCAPGLHGTVLLQNLLHLLLTHGPLSCYTLSSPVSLQLYLLQYLHQFHHVSLVFLPLHGLL